MINKLATRLARNWITALEILLLVLTGPVTLIVITMLPALPGAANT